VRFHVTNAFRKLQTDNRAGLAARVHALLDAHRRASGDAVPAATLMAAVEPIDA
jgi:DNA-binding NarL/FixJ family response regulator